MKSLWTSAVVTAALAALAEPALGQGLNGADISLSAGHHSMRNTSGSLQTGLLEAQVEFGLGAGLFLQIDGGIEPFRVSIGSQSEDKHFAALGGHLGYEFSSSTALGLYGTYERWPEVGETYDLGGEVVVRSGPVRIEAHAGHRGIVDSSLSGHDFGVDAAYRFNDRLSLTAGAGALRFDAVETLVQGAAGLRYDIADGFAVDLGYARTRAWSGGRGMNSIGLALTKTIDGGATFSSRNVMSTLHGW